VKKLFTYEEAAALLPKVQELTKEAVEELDALPEGATDQHERVVTQWAESIIALGIDVKGLWLVDFDNGSGYYCWHYPEGSLQFFHGYEEGFGSRVPLQ
jgi:Uncharacterized conserved protein